MAFQPQVNGSLTINGLDYTIMEHPYAPGVPYGQEGRQGIVYLLHSKEKRHKRALKVFRSKLLNPSSVLATQQITKFAGISGLAVCERYILTPQNNPELLNKEPDLLYAIVMPWIEGPTWMDVLLNKQLLTKRQSHSAAYALAEILATMEQRGLAHCDLSGPNVMLPMLKEDNQDIKASAYVQLIDIEQMYSVQFSQPDQIPGGSPGYAPKQKTRASMWSPQADRFAGAVLLMEMLAACSESFFINVWGESYFAPAELQSGGSRFDQLLDTIRSTWGNGLANLFVRAWESEEAGQCATFGEWLVELSRVDPAALKAAASAPVVQAAEIAPEKPVKPAKPVDQPGKQAALLQKAKELEDKGKYKDAMDVYRSIRKNNPHSSLEKEIDIALTALEEKLKSRKKPRAALPMGLALRFAGKMATVCTVIAVVGVGGYWGYNHYKNRNSAGTAAAPAVTSEEKAALLATIAEKEQIIKTLTEQVQELSKPTAQKREDLINALNDDYLNIQGIAAMEPSQNPQLEKKAFDASAAYIDHLFGFIRNNYNLEPKFATQFNTVGGYYYPYLYNENRNAQLNLQFFKSYKSQF